MADFKRTRRPGATPPFWSPNPKHPFKLPYGQKRVCFAHDLNYPFRAPHPLGRIALSKWTIWGGDDLSPLVGLFGLRCFRVDQIAPLSGRSGATTI